MSYKLIYAQNQAEKSCVMTRKTTMKMIKIELIR